MCGGSRQVGRAVGAMAKGTGKATEMRGKLKGWRGTWGGEGKNQGCCTGSEDGVSLWWEAEGRRDGMTLWSEGQRVISGARGREPGIICVPGSWGHRSRMIWGREEKGGPREDSFKRRVGRD